MQAVSCPSLQMNMVTLQLGQGEYHSVVGIISVSPLPLGHQIPVKCIEYLLTISETLTSPLL